MKETRNKKFGGSMKQSEYDLLITLVKQGRFESQVDCIVSALNLLDKKLQKAREKEIGIFEQKKE